MRTEIKTYLDDVRSHLRLDPVTESHIIGELSSYFQDKITELQENGLSEDDAVRESIKSCGRTRVVARLMYEAYSKGNWTEALLSTLPHLIVAGVFATHMWNNPIVAPLVFALLVGVTLYGWWHGKPNWLYSWIGYAMLPLLAGAWASHGILGRMFSFITGNGPSPGILLTILICVFLAVSLRIVTGTAFRVVKRDWILASLMLTPLPIVGSWFYEIDRFGGLFQSSNLLVHQWDKPMAIVLIVLAVASAIFIRLRKRIYKGTALLTLSFISMMTFSHILWADRGFFSLLALAVLSLIFLVSPLFIESRIGHGELTRQPRR